MNAILAVRDTGHTAAGPDAGDEHVDLERYRAELIGYCRAKLGSVADAEDAAQETLIRAWRSLDGFEGRAMLRSWLYCIATNVCIDLLRARQRRAAPVGLEGAASSLLDRTADETGLVAVAGPNGHDPAEEIVRRDQVSHAFTRMLRLLPPRQRAVLFLREVLRWRAHEVAELLGTTTAAVNSGLQRARATLAAEPSAAPPRPASTSEGHGPGAAQYVEAFASYDVDMLVSLLERNLTRNLAERSDRSAIGAERTMATEHVPITDDAHPVERDPHVRRQPWLGRKLEAELGHAVIQRHQRILSSLGTFRHHIPAPCPGQDSIGSTSR